MRNTDFDFYKELLKEKSGLILTPDKVYLIDSRLNPIAKKWEYQSLDDMTEALKKSLDKKLVGEIVEAMTNKDTSFFKDQKSLNIFKKTVLKYLHKNRAGEKTINIWCAAASTGQEPYSVSMAIKEQEDKFAGWKINILATDISSKLLDKAKTGIYSQFEVQLGVPIRGLISNFSKTGENWQINEDIRKSVRFEYFNLLDDMSKLGGFDVIFCRNVLQSLDEEVQKDIVIRMGAQLADDGFLFTGSAEDISNITENFKASPDKNGLYTKSAGKSK